MLSPISQFRGGPFERGGNNMHPMLPEAKEYQKGSAKTKPFNRIGISVKIAALSLHFAISKNIFLIYSNI